MDYLVGLKQLVDNLYSGMDKPFWRVSVSYRGWQPKLSHSGLLWLRLTVVEIKNITGKLLTFFYCLAFHSPAERDLFNRYNTGRLHDFAAVEIIVTHGVLTTIIVLLTRWMEIWICCPLNI